MGLKGELNEDHIPLNKYSLLIVGAIPPEITFTAVSGLESEVVGTDLPDRTTASGGQKNPSEFTVKVPTHHTLDIIFMDGWLEEGVDPVSPFYKKNGVLQMVSGRGAIRRIYSLEGIWCMKRKLPDMAMEEEGGLAENEYTLKVDDVTLIPV